jgi:hypothetical protein
MRPKFDLSHEVTAVSVVIVVAHFSLHVCAETFIAAKTVNAAIANDRHLLKEMIMSVPE